MLRTPALWRSMLIGSNSYRQSHRTVSAPYMPIHLISNIEDKEHRQQGKKATLPLPVSLAADPQGLQQYHQRREYHSTPRNELVVYAAIAVFACAGYVAYRKYQGLPLKPIEATQAQEDFRRKQQKKEGLKRYTVPAAKGKEDDNASL